MHGFVVMGWVSICNICEHMRGKFLLLGSIILRHHSSTNLALVSRLVGVIYICMYQFIYI